MPISAQVIADSINSHGNRLMTFKLRYPKFIHGEFMTHRVISRNASSSRAIPVSKLIQEVEDDALRAGPIYWGKEQKGMSPAEELQGAEKFDVMGHWRWAAFDAANHAKAMSARGAHKSIVNRLLEPFSHINVVATATEWDNFFGLRLDKAAQPEMRALAVAMWEARKASTPKLLKPGQWHLPFCADVHGKICTPANDDAIKVSVARCARVSYESFETGKRSTIDEDLKLYDRLVGSQPLHASPAEHPATPDDVEEYTTSFTSVWKKRWVTPQEHGNFVGWRQYRKMLPGEAVAPLPVEFA